MDVIIELPRPPVTCWGMLPTPFAGTGAMLDLASLHRTAVQYVADGCDGVVVLGLVGEPGTLTAHEKSRVIEAVSDLGVPVVAAALVGGADGILAEVEQVIAPAAHLLAGVMVPVLHPTASACGVWLDRVHDLTGLPVLVQDLPQSTGVHIDVAELAVAVADRTWLLGVKCEAPPTYQRIAALAAHGVPGLMCGFGGLSLVADLTAGATAVAIGVTVPDAVVTAARYWTAGDDEAARHSIDTWASRINLETQPGPSIAIRKEHLRRRGLLADAQVRTPTAPWEEDFARLSRAVGA